MQRSTGLQRTFAALSAIILAGGIGLLPAADAARGPVLQTIAVVGGQPDDITVDAHNQLVWGDLAAGTVRRLDGARVATIASGIVEPEGVVALADGSLVIAGQGRDHLLRVDTHGNLSVLYTLQPVPGQDGVDGIGFDPRTDDLLVPDSPRGTVLRVSLGGRMVSVLARGLGRPVDAAVDRSGDVLVPDEHLGTLVLISPKGAISYRGTFRTPDDVAVSANGAIWVTTLGDGGLWVINSGAAPRRVLVGLANPQGLTLDRCGDPIVVEQNAARIVRLLLSPFAARCTF